MDLMVIICGIWVYVKGIWEIRLSENGEQKWHIPNSYERNQGKKKEKKIFQKVLCNKPVLYMYP